VLATFGIFTQLNTAINNKGTEMGLQMEEPPAPEVVEENPDKPPEKEKKSSKKK
jgi:hypothetical protein